MEYITVKARAKINLALDVLAKRPDGYHELKMVMQTVNLSDSIYIKKTYQGLRITSNLPWLPVDERNLAYKAAAYLSEAFAIRRGVFINLKKSIPVSAGLAGGSSDCAAVLVGMRTLYNLPLSNKDLMEIGKNFGADVPYCVMRGTALAEGIGDRLTRLPSHPRTYILIAKPSFSVSTGDVFKRFDPSVVETRPDFEKLLRGLKKKSADDISANLCNVLESVTIPLYPIVSQIKELMLSEGSTGALMSGSGPSVFGYFSNKSGAEKAADRLRTEMNIRDCFVTDIFNTADRID